MVARSAAGKNRYFECYLHGGAKRRRIFFREIGMIYRYFMKNPSRTINLISHLFDLHRFACDSQLINPWTDLYDLIQFCGNQLIN